LIGSVTIEISTQTVEGKTMNETVQAETAKMQMVEFLGWIKELVQSGTDIATKEIPEILRQFIAWGLYSHIFWLVLILAIGTGALFLAKYFAKKYQTGKNNIHSFYSDEIIEGWQVGAIILRILAPLVMILGASHNLYYIIMILVAPRMYLIERFSALLKNQ
jgi:hypothetical protein